MCFRCETRRFSLNLGPKTLHSLRGLHHQINWLLPVLLQYYQIIREADDHHQLKLTTDALSTKFEIVWKRILTLVGAKQQNRERMTLWDTLFHFGRNSRRGVHKHNCSHGIQAGQKKLLELGFQWMYQQTDTKHIFHSCKSRSSIFIHQ